MRIEVKYFKSKKSAQDYLTMIRYSGAYKLNQSIVSGEWVLEYEVYE